jgi:hypothetical protein
VPAAAAALAAPCRAVPDDVAEQKQVSRASAHQDGGGV